MTRVPKQAHYHEDIIKRGKVCHLNCRLALHMPQWKAQIEQQCQNDYAYSQSPYYQQANCLFNDEPCVIPGSAEMVFGSISGLGIEFQEITKNPPVDGFGSSAAIQLVFNPNGSRVSCNRDLLLPILPQT